MKGITTMTKEVKAPRVKRLLIQNSDRYYNVNLMKRSDIEEKIKVTRLNEQAIEEDMDILAARSIRYPAKDQNNYIIYQEKYTNDNLITKMMKHAGGISYYTDSIVPYYILQELSSNLNSECIYSLRPNFSVKEIENIDLAYMATRVIIDCPIVIPDMSPYDLLFILHDLKTNVDNVQLSFPSLTEAEFKPRHKEYYHKVGNLYEVKPNYKFSFFKHVQTSLSIWKMNLFLISNGDEDYNALNELIEQDLRKRNNNSNRKKKTDNG